MTLQVIQDRATDDRSWGRRITETINALLRSGGPIRKLTLIGGQNEIALDIRQGPSNTTDIHGIKLTLSNVTGNPGIWVEGTLNAVQQCFMSHNYSNGTNASNWLEVGNELSAREIALVNTSTTYTAAGFGPLNTGHYKGLVGIGGDPVHIQSNGTNPDMKIGGATGHKVYTCGDTSAAWEDISGDSGSFTGTFTGFSGSVSGTIYWKKTGQFVSLRAGAQISGTSNATTFTITGLPAVIQPATNRFVNVSGLINNGVDGLIGGFSINGGTISVQRMDMTTGSVSVSNWTASGTKGVEVGFTAIYPLV